MKQYIEEKITGWYMNAKADYDVDGKFISATENGDNLEIVWEEDGTRCAMTIGFYKTFTPEEIYNIWMASDWEEAA